MGNETPITILYEEWEELLHYIVAQESVSAIFSINLKRNKGWTYRNGKYGQDVHIDFWNDNAKAMFLLSYSHIIEKSLKIFKKPVAADQN